MAPIECYSTSKSRRSTLMCCEKGATLAAAAKWGKNRKRAGRQATVYQWPVRRTSEDPGTSHLKKAAHLGFFFLQYSKPKELERRFGKAGIYRQPPVEHGLRSDGYRQAGRQAADPISQETSRQCKGVG
jgi:hypothetical protein